MGTNVITDDMNECEVTAPHGCEGEGELRLYHPQWEEPAYVCRGALRQLGDGVDARTWLEAGYAAWAEDERPLPQEPESEGPRDQLDERMEWRPTTQPRAIPRD